MQEQWLPVHIDYNRATMLTSLGERSWLRGQLHVQRIMTIQVHVPKTRAYAYLWLNSFHTLVPVCRNTFDGGERENSHKQTQIHNPDGMSHERFFVRNRPMPWLNQREISFKCQAFLGAPGITR